MGRLSFSRYKLFIFIRIPVCRCYCFQWAILKRGSLSFSLPLYLFSSAHNFFYALNVSISWYSEILHQQTKKTDHVINFYISVLWTMWNPTMDMDTTQSVYAGICSSQPCAHGDKNQLETNAFHKINHNKWMEKEAEKEWERERGGTKRTVQNARADKTDDFVWCAPENRRNRREWDRNDNLLHTVAALNEFSTTATNKTHHRDRALTHSISFNDSMCKSALSHTHKRTSRAVWAVANPRINSSAILFIPFFISPVRLIFERRF